MAVKVFIKRHFISGNTPKITRLLRKARFEAMGFGGYVSSETLSDYHDPNRVTVMSMWRTLEDWEAWKQSPERKSNESKMESILERPPEYEVYNLGIAEP